MSEVKQHTLSVTIKTNFYNKFVFISHGLVLNIFCSAINVNLLCQYNKKLGKNKITKGCKQMIFRNTILRPCQGKTYKRALMPCANSEGHAQTAHSRSLIRTFVVRL